MSIQKLKITMPQFLPLLRAAQAYRLDDGPVLNTFKTDSLKDENVGSVTFTWEESADIGLTHGIDSTHVFGCTFEEDEDGHVRAELRDGELYVADTYNNLCLLRLYLMQGIEVARSLPASCF